MLYIGTGLPFFLHTPCSSICMVHSIHKDSIGNRMKSMGSIWNSKHMAPVMAKSREG